jgi:hypothetical protein
MSQIPVRINQTHLDSHTSSEWHTWFSAALKDGVLQNCQVAVDGPTYLVLPTGGRRRLHEGFVVDLPKNVREALDKSPRDVKPFETTINIPDRFKRYITKPVRESIYGVYVPKNKIKK